MEVVDGVCSHLAILITLLRVKILCRLVDEKGSNFGHEASFPGEGASSVLGHADPTHGVVQSISTKLGGFGSELAQLLLDGFQLRTFLATTLLCRHHSHQVG